jgi:hypothetical protein
MPPLMSHPTPHIDVTLQTDGTDWSPWIALASFIGVLVASLLTGRSTRKAAERNAQALLAVEDARTETEHRRHLRGLVADVASAGAEYTSALHNLLLPGATDGDDEVVTQAAGSFKRAMALLSLTTSQPLIVTALKEVTDANSRLDDLLARNAEDEDASSLSTGILSALYGGDGIEETCDHLVAVATQHLADAPRTSRTE